MPILSTKELERTQRQCKRQRSVDPVTDDDDEYSGESDIALRFSPTAKDMVEPRSRRRTAGPDLSTPSPSSVGSTAPAIDASAITSRRGCGRSKNCRDYRHKLHMHYEAEVAADRDPRDRFSSNAFQELSKKNRESRSKQKVTHCGRSQSFVRYRHEMRDQETGAPPSPIDLWHKMHYNPEKGWAGPEAQRLYEEMVQLRARPTPEGEDPLTDDQIQKTVLGRRRGYVRGLRSGMQPTLSSSTVESDARIHEATQRAEAFERSNAELEQMMTDLSARMTQLESLLQTFLSQQGGSIQP